MSSTPEDDVTVAAELTDDVAEREIAAAHSAARKYVRWIRRRRPEATPAEVIRFLERQYLAAITVAGGLVSAGGVALEAGIAMIPGGGLAASATKKVARRLGAQRVTKLVPSGDEQLQLQITALYALALADIHGLDLDEAGRSALVHGLADDPGDSAPGTAPGTAPPGRSRWAARLARSLPADGAQELVRGMRDGKRSKRAAVRAGVAAARDGVTRFRFGREVVEATQEAFAEPPAEFPPHLALPDTPETDDATNPALAVLTGTAGHWLGGSAPAIGTGVDAARGAVTAAAAKVRSPFRPKPG